jgi:transposase
MYATDLTDAQWQFTKSSLTNVTRKRKYELRFIVNAMLYVVKTGCQWRMLPNDSPKWQLVYYYYRKWARDGTWDLLLDHLRGKARTKKKQNENPTMGIMDSQSVRSANNKAQKGIDGNKKVKGRKRHIVVDKNGWLLSVMVSAANIHDSKAADLLLEFLKETIAGIKLLVADGGYRGGLAERIKKQFGYSLKIIMRPDEKNKGFIPLPI